MNSVEQSPSLIVSYSKENMFRPTSTLLPDDSGERDRLPREKGGAQVPGGEPQEL